MIVWSGNGFLSILVLGASIFLLGAILPETKIDYGFSFAFFIAGAFSWFMGKRWNEAESKVVIEKSTGKELIIRPNHTLFWIKIQYWGIIFVIFGCLFLYTEFFPN